MAAPRPAAREQTLAGLALTVNAFVWGVSWWPFRQLLQAGLHPLWATALTYLLAVALIGARSPRAWRQLLRSPALWLILLASGCTNATFNWAVTTGDVVRVVLLFYLMPFWAVLLARVVLGERLATGTLLRVALALCGAAVVLWPEDGGWPWPRTPADALAIAGGFCFALNNVMLRRAADQPKEGRALAMFLGGALVAGMTALAVGPQHGIPWPPAPGPWIAGAVALGVLFIAGNLSLQYGAPRLPAHATAVIMLTEVVFASVSALLLGGGALSGRLALGGALIVSAAVLAAAGRERAPAH
jgi:drug/metabolite transporter (DMT)-like permease